MEQPINIYMNKDFQKARKYAYLQKVENSKIRTSANSEYTQIVTEDMEVYFFTNDELENAKLRATKNPEDQKLVEITYVGKELL
jgi:hypothetical protein